jgi:hypothetical protein
MKLIESGLHVHLACEEAIGNLDSVKATRVFL